MVALIWLFACAVDEPVDGLMPVGSYNDGTWQITVDELGSARLERGCGSGWIQNFTAEAGAIDREFQWNTGGGIETPEPVVAHLSATATTNTIDGTVTFDRDGASPESFFLERAAPMEFYACP